MGGILDANGDVVKRESRARREARSGDSGTPIVREYVRTAAPSKRARG